MIITFIIHNLNAGGAERVASLLCNHWAKNNEVHIITHTQSKPHYPLDPTIQQHHLYDQLIPSSQIVKRIARFVSKAMKLRKLLKKTKPDIVVSFLFENNILSAIAHSGLPGKLILSERTHPGHFISLEFERLFSPFKRFFKFNLYELFNVYSRQFFYRKSDKIIVQNPSIQSWFKIQTGLDTTIIENPIDLKCFDHNSTEDNKTIISVGRFSEEKNHSMLLDAFLNISDQFPNWTLKLYGDGPLKEELINQIKDHPHQNRVHFMGVTPHTHKTIKEGDIFLLPSKVEGFPNVLLEALASGCCVLSTKFPGFPDKLENYVKTCEISTSSMQNLLKETMEQPELRQSMKTKSIEGVQSFDVQNISKLWLQLFEK